MSALTLRIIACATMLVDHLGYEIGNLEFRLIGRIAFPIFVFLIVNGYRHTSNKALYALRLAVFAVVSQIPFSLFCYNRVDFSHGNVLMTLFLALICIWIADCASKQKYWRYLSLLPAICVCALYHFEIISSDYGAKGIMLAFLFFFVNGRSVKNGIILAVGMVVIFMYGHILTAGMQGIKGIFGLEYTLPMVSAWDLRQLFCVGSLVPIMMYNDKKGKYPQSRLVSKLLQYGFYAFYPAHMLLLWLIYG